MTAVKAYSDGRRPFTDEERDRLKRLTLGGTMSWKEIGRLLGRTPETCKVTASVHGWRRPGTILTFREPAMPRSVGEPVGEIPAPIIEAARSRDIMHAQNCLAGGGFVRVELVGTGKTQRVMAIWP